MVKSKVLKLSSKGDQNEGFRKHGWADEAGQSNAIKMKKLQEDLALATYEGAAGGGAVKVTVTGAQTLQSVVISPDLFKSGDAEMLQDLVMLATNEALKTAKDTSAKEMEKITGGFNMPGLF